MRNLSEQAGPFEPPTQRHAASIYGDVRYSVAYCDTLIALTDATRVPEAKLQAAQRGQGSVEVETYEDSGCKITLQRPAEASIKILAAMERGYRVTLVRCDLANDPVGPEPKAFTDHLTRHLLLKYRPPGVGMWNEDNGVYNIDTRALTAKLHRNLLIYGDRAKIDMVPWPHIELRFLTMEAIRAIGIRRVSDLLYVNPRAVFKRYLILVDDFADEYAAMIVRQQRAAVVEDRKRYQGRRVHRVVDKYRARIAHYVEHAIRAGSQGRAQLLHSKMRIRPISLDVLKIPETLTWQ